MNRAHADNSRMHKLNGRFLAPMVFIIVAFIGLVGWQSLFGIQPPPIEIHQSDAFAYATNGVTLLQYNKKMHVRSHIRIMLDRTVECGKNNLTYDFPTSYRESDVGDYAFDGRLMIPFKIDPGTSCTLYTMVRYQPTFSIRTHSYYAMEIKFKVVENSTNQMKE